MIRLKVIDMTEKRFKHSECEYSDNSMINLRCELKKNNVNFHSDFCDAECPIVQYLQILRE